MRAQIPQLTADDIEVVTHSPNSISLQSAGENDELRPLSPRKISRCWFIKFRLEQGKTIQRNRKENKRGERTNSDSFLKKPKTTL